jgi:polyhydroxyalkanoate synthesis regulator phasin
MIEALRKNTENRDNPRRHSSSDRGAFRREEYARAKERIDEMVAEGKVSREDADRRLGEMRRRISRDREGRGRETRTITRQEYASSAEAIEKMVAEGVVSREDADRRLGEMRRAIDSRQGEKGDSRQGEKGVEARFVPEEEYIRVEAELKKLVDEGKVSRLDADRRLRELQTANTQAHIEASVKSGETTRAEADKLYKELGYK